MGLVIVGGHCYTGSRGARKELWVSAEGHINMVAQQEEKAGEGNAVTPSPSTLQFPTRASYWLNSADPLNSTPGSASMAQSRVGEEAE